MFAKQKGVSYMVTIIKFDPKKYQPKSQKKKKEIPPKSDYDQYYTKAVSYEECMEIFRKGFLQGVRIKGDIEGKAYDAVLYELTNEEYLDIKNTMKDSLVAKSFLISGNLWVIVSPPLLPLLPKPSFWSKIKSMVFKNEK